MEDSAIPAENYHRIVASSAHLFVKAPMFSVRFYGLNLRMRPLGDRRVRQAIIHALDRSAVTDEIFLGRFLPARGIPDPDNFLFKPFHSRNPRNIFGYANPTVDDLLTRARGERDLQRRLDLYRRAEQLIVDDAPILPVLHYTYERLFQRYVRNVEVNGLGDAYIPLRKIWLERRG